MLKTLCMLDGVSGNEQYVRELIKTKITPLCDTVTVDPMGNLIGFLDGDGEKTVLLCAHMDEVGFITSHVTPDGFVKVKPVGGMDCRILPGQRVLVGEKKIPGVFGFRAVHHASKEEKGAVPDFRSLFLDVGGAAVERGEYVSFDSEYRIFGDSKVKAKALDDRAGCAALIRLLEERRRYPFRLYVCFSVQEEAGLRGASVLANRIRPDFALAVESTTCSDLCGNEAEFVTELGRGPAISIADRASVSCADYRDAMIRIAREHQIPYQLKTAVSGGNDAGAFQLYGRGAATLVLSLPTRYIHSPVSVIDLNDYEHYCSLLLHFTAELGGLL